MWCEGKKQQNHRGILLRKVWELLTNLRAALIDYFLPPSEQSNKLTIQHLLISLYKVYTDLCCYLAARNDAHENHESESKQDSFRPQKPNKRFKAKFYVFKTMSVSFKSFGRIQQ